MGCIWYCFPFSVCTAMAPHVSATCNCDHGTMLLAGCSDCRITAWATSSIFSRSPGPGALAMDRGITTVTEFDTSVRRVEDSEEETLNVLLFTKHSYMPSCRFCPMWHASCPGILKNIASISCIMPYISHQLGTSATCRVANKAPHFWTLALGCQQLELLEDH